MNGADELPDDAPGAMATKLVVRATLYEKVYGAASAASRACPTAGN